MTLFDNISSDGIDTFCSVFGKELIVENKKETHLLLPAYNLGFYDNSINKESFTKSIKKCYLLFKNIKEFNIHLNLYDSLLPNKNGKIELSNVEKIYKFKYEDKPYNKSDLEIIIIEGMCLRHKSFSYATFTTKSESLNIIVTDYILSDYANDNPFKYDAEIKRFLFGEVIDRSIFELI